MGNEILNGGAGADSIYIDNFDTSIVGCAEVGVIDNSITCGATGAVVLSLKTSQIEKVTATASTYDNVFDATGATWAVNITGDLLNNLLDGGDSLLGNDTILGSGGVDSIINA